jgi:LacI family transcriptional regulator
LEKRKLTIADVAALAGVSVGTVSNVLNQTIPVSKAKRDRVLKAIQELGYSQNMLAHGLRRKRSPVVGLCVPHTSIAYFSALVDAFEEVASSNGIEIMQVLSRQDSRTEYERVQSLLKYHVGGILLVPSMEPEETFAMLKASGVPVVVVDRAPQGFDFDRVTFDNTTAMRQATRELIDRGHRNILFIVRQRRLIVTVQRVQGLIEAAAAAPSPVTTKVLESGPDEATLTALLSIEMQKPKRPTAIIVSNSTIAAEVFRAMRVLKLECPKDVSLLAFDEPEWADLITPSLSVVRQPTREIARMSWTFLIQRMKNQADSTQQIQLEAKVIIRDSVRAIGRDEPLAFSAIA